MPFLSSDLQPHPAPARVAAHAPWLRPKRSGWQVPLAGAAAHDARQVLRLDRLPELSSFEAFEEHLATVLNSGVCVFFDGAEPLLLAGQSTAGAVSGLRIVIGLDERGASRFHVLGPGVDASFAMADGAFLAGESDRRRTDLIRYWYQHAKPHLIKVWNDSRSFQPPVGPHDAA